MAIEARNDRATERSSSIRTATLSGTIIVCIFACVLGAKVSGAAPAPPQGPGEPQRWIDMLPNGNGREIVAQNCVLCHTVERIVTSHRPKAAWEALVKLMALRGCPVDDEQVATVIDYVSKNFGPVRKEAAAAQPANSSPDRPSGTASAKTN